MESLSLKDLPGLEVVSSYKVDRSMDIFQGHFPGNPVFPGVLQIEIMAQTACFGLRRLFRKSENSFNIEVALAKIGESKFRRPILPGSELTIVCCTQQVRGPMINFDGKIYCNDEMMSEATFMATHNLKH